MAQIVERLPGLRLDPFGHPAGGGIDGQLARKVKGSDSLDGLRVGAHGLRRVRRCDDLFHGVVWLLFV